MGDHLCLVGMMGAGKSEVGRILGKRARRPFLDTDLEIAIRAGTSVAEMFESRGEASFRRIESSLVCGLLAGLVPRVLALGGGAVADPIVRHRLRSCATVVFLDAAPAVLESRVGSGEGRPLLAGDAAAVLSRLRAARLRSYRDVADVTVDSSAGAPSVIAETVFRKWQLLGRTAEGSTPIRDACS